MKKTGSFSYSLTEESAANLIVNIGQEKDLNFKFIVTGDNDDHDCAHTGLSFDVEILYLK